MTPPEPRQSPPQPQHEEAEGLREFPVHRWELKRWGLEGDAPALLWDQGHQLGIKVTTKDGGISGSIINTSKNLERYFIL